MKKLFIALMLCCGLCYADGLTIYHITAQMWVESNGDWRAISNKNCHGPMQVMPATGAEYGYPEWALTHPVIGMDAGIEIMRDLWSRFVTLESDSRSRFVTNSNSRTIKDYLIHDVRRNILRNQTWALALSAFNCGYSRTLKALRLGHRWRDGIPAETRHYIKKVLRQYYRR